MSWGRGTQAQITTVGKTSIRYSALGIGVRGKRRFSSARWLVCRSGTEYDRYRVPDTGYWCYYCSWNARPLAQAVDFQPSRSLVAPSVTLYELEHETSARQSGSYGSWAVTQSP